MRMVVERGAHADGRTLNLMSKRCSTALRELRRKGLTKSVEGPAGYWLLWDLVRVRVTRPRYLELSIEHLQLTGAVDRGTRGFALRTEASSPRISAEN